MRKIFAIVCAVIAFTALVTAVCASDDSLSAPIRDTALPTADMLAGSYHGDVAARNGNDAFRVTLKPQGPDRFEGDLEFYKGIPECRGTVSITGKIVGKEIVIDAPGKMSRCNRTLILDIKALSGKLGGPLGSFDVKLRKM